ncbi:MAG: RNA 2',3'-cyclic phosphodiesterase [bacterium]|nr:RNA 2',3'-cyclic phosphodiesterase [bacterium]
MKGHRLFIAINIPPEVREMLRKETETWRDLPIRWVSEENIHITLLFIGAADDEEMSRIATVLPMATEGIESFDITLDRIGIGPTPKTPRMVWAEGEVSVELTALQRKVRECVFPEGRYIQEAEEAEYPISPSGILGTGNTKSPMTDKKPFKLHVTLGRMIPFRWKQLGSGAPHIEKTLDISFPVHSIELMESEPGPKGPTYTVLSSAGL